MRLDCLLLLHLMIRQAGSARLIRSVYDDMASGLFPNT
jgi:hypothetical protein